MRNKPWLLPVVVLTAFGLAGCEDTTQTESGDQAATEQQQEGEQETRTAARDTQSQRAQQDTQQGTQQQRQDVQNTAAGSQMAGTGQQGQEGEQIQAVSVAESEEFGRYLVAEDGRAVYVYFADSQGQSNCTGQCAEKWPPVLAQNGQPQVDDPSIDQSKLGTVQREDGSQQVTYDGNPLYFYAEDRGPGEATGQGVNNQWALVTTEGEPVESRARGSARM